MKKILAASLLFIFAAGSFTLFASGVHEGKTDGSAELSGGIELYNDGNLKEAVAAFKKAASSDNPETAAAGYYNYGTAAAILAEQDSQADGKRGLLEESYESIRHALELGTLPSSVQQQARQNMELIRKKLASMPPESRQQDNRQSGDKQTDDKQSGDKQQGDQKSDSRSETDSGDAAGGADKQGESGGGRTKTPQELLEEQKNLTEASGGGQGADDELADAQQQLSSDSEEAELDEAAVSQAKAAEALRSGDREKALEYQKSAEKALENALADQRGNQEAEDIMNQEADYRAQKNKLDKKGGIFDAERNW